MGVLKDRLAISKRELISWLRVVPTLMKGYYKPKDIFIDLEGLGEKLRLHITNHGDFTFSSSLAGEGSLTFQPVSVKLTDLKHILSSIEGKTFHLGKNKNQLVIVSGGSKFTISVLESDNLFAPHEGETTHFSIGNLAKKVKIFTSINPSGNGSWHSSGFMPDGFAYTTDRFNLFRTSFPIVEGADNGILIPCYQLGALALFKDDIDICIPHSSIIFKDETNYFELQLHPGDIPNYEKVTSKLAGVEEAELDLSKITKHVKSVKRMSKDALLKVTINNGKMDVALINTSDLSYNHSSEVVGPNCELVINPENYLKLIPAFGNKARVVKVDGAHLVIKDEESLAMIACPPATIKFI